MQKPILVDTKQVELHLIKLKVHKSHWHWLPAKLVNQNIHEIPSELVDHPARSLYFHEQKRYKEEKKSWYYLSVCLPNKWGIHVTNLISSSFASNCWLPSSASLYLYRHLLKYHILPYQTFFVTLDEHTRDLFCLCAYNINLVTSVNLRNKAALAQAWRDEMSDRTIFILFSSLVHYFLLLRQLLKKFNRHKE